MDKVGVALKVEANWFSAYNIVVLPKEYANKTIPDHWKALAAPVLPARRGIPTFRRVTIERVRALNSTPALQAKGSESSSILAFSLTSFHIEAKAAGTIQYAKVWSFKNTPILPPDGKREKTE